MKRPAFLTAAAAALLAAATASAQTPTVEARIVPDSIGIGDTFTLEIDVERDQVQVTEFPLYENDDKLEVVQSLPVDTLSREGRRLRLRKRYVMQAFSEGRYNLGRPGVLYADKNIVDTLYTSDSLRLDVGTFQIDTAKQTIYDLKPQRTLRAARRGDHRIPFRRVVPAAEPRGAALRAALSPVQARQTPERPLQTRAARTAPRRGDPRARRASQPEIVAEQQTQGLLFGADRHPAPLSGGALRHRRLGDDLRRDHRCGTSARPAPARAPWSSRRCCAKPIW